jgi:hypothetical protein
VKPRHRVQILGQYLTVSGFQSLHQIADGLVGFVVDLFYFHDFSFRAVSGLFFSSLERQRKKQPERGQRNKRSRRRVAGREGRRDECQTRLGFVWREIGA